MVNVEIVEWLSWFDARDYEFARQVLQRGTAALYFLAFLSTLNQFPALLGERGLLPVPDFLGVVRRMGRPTLFRWRYSDRLLRAVCIFGLAVSALLVLGLPQTGPPWLPMIAFLALWFLYMSIVNVGQTFYGFGWEVLLLEAGFTVAFLGSDQTPPPATILVVSASVADAKPEWEQVLSAGAVCMNLVHAANALGYATNWITDWYAYDADALTLFGMKTGERVAGFIHIGTVAEPPLERPRPDMTTKVEFKP